MSRLFSKFARYYDRFMSTLSADHTDDILKVLNFKEQKRIGDIGGGTGLLADKLVRLGHKVTIIDPCKEMTDLAKQRNAGIKVLNETLGSLPKGEIFDCLVLRDSLHHIPNHQQLLAQCAAVLSLGGKIVIQDFRPNCWQIRCLFAIERFCGEKVTPASPEQLTQMLEENHISGEVRFLGKCGYLYIGKK